MVRLDEIDSTMEEVRRRLRADREAAGDGLVVVAARQSGGRGRFGRAWASPAGGLWFTLGRRIEGDRLASVGAFGLEAGLAVCEAVETALDQAGASVPALLKWPNDVLVHDRKVAGVLCEVDDPGREPTLLIGIGINCNFERAELPEEVTERAETLQSVAGRPIDREALFEAIVAGLVRAVESPRPLREIARAASDRLARRGEQTDVTTPDGARLRGRLLGLDDAGRARLETEAGEVTLPSGAAIAEQARDDQGTSTTGELT